jgi:uncharacterized protein
VAKRKRKSSRKISIIYIYGGAIALMVVVALLLLPYPEDHRKDDQTKTVPPAPVPVPVPQPEKPVPELVKRGELVIVIDDVGHNLHDLEPMLRFPGAITFAVLPGLEFSREALNLILAAGKDAILHQPMEAVGGNNPGPGAIYVEMDEKTIRRQLAKNLDELKGVTGVNNHMGSKATSDSRVMRAVMEELKARKVYFLDSRTTAETVGKALSQEIELPYLERSVFLDNTKEREAIIDAFQDGMRLAEKRGRAVMIGHVFTHELAEVLLELYPEAIEQGFVFLSARDLVDYWD